MAIANVAILPMMTPATSPEDFDGGVCVEVSSGELGSVVVLTLYPPVVTVT